MNTDRIEDTIWGERPLMTFSGKVVIVTGASSGIGAAAALLFSKEGAQVAIVGRNEVKLTTVEQQCAAVGLPPLVIKADVANEEEASTIIQKTVENYGQLDVLVNNAGIMRSMSVSDPNILQVFDKVMNTNLRSVVQLSSLSAPYLAATKGNIVNVSSISALCVSGSNFMPYGVSKAGLDQFTRCAALDLAPSGIRVNTVNPGPVKTDIIENSGLAPVGADEVVWEMMKKSTALGRVGDPEEIAEIIAFLASDKARGVTGSSYVSDNGGLINRQLLG